VREGHGAHSVRRSTARAQVATSGHIFKKTIQIMETIFAWCAGVRFVGTPLAGALDTSLLASLFFRGGWPGKVPAWGLIIGQAALVATGSHEIGYSNSFIPMRRRQKPRLGHCTRLCNRSEFLLVSRFHVRPRSRSS